MQSSRPHDAVSDPSLKLTKRSADCIMVAPLDNKQSFSSRVKCNTHRLQSFMSIPPVTLGAFPLQEWLGNIMEPLVSTAGTSGEGSLTRLSQGLNLKASVIFKPVIKILNSSSVYNEPWTRELKCKRASHHGYHLPPLLLALFLKSLITLSFSQTQRSDNPRLHSSNNI